MVATAPEEKLTHRAPTYEELDSLYDINIVFFVQKITSVLRKINRAALFDCNMHQTICWLGLHPRPHWGSLQCSPRPLVVFRWPASKGRGGEGERKGGAKRRGREFVLCPKKKKSCWLLLYSCEQHTDQLTNRHAWTTQHINATHAMRANAAQHGHFIAPHSVFYYI